MRANSTAPWRYGWLRLQTISNANPVTLNIEAYALAAIPLALLPARAAGWQIYLTYVADQLTIDPPVAASKGQLTVPDLCGQTHLSADLAGGRQWLDLSALAVGVYLLQLETTADSFTQRIIKR